MGAGPHEGDTQFRENQQKWNGPEVISWMLSFSHHSLFPRNSHIIIYVEANFDGKDSVLYLDMSLSSPAFIEILQSSIKFS